MLRVYTSEQNNEQVGPHFKVKEFACKDGSAITFIDDYMVTILELLRKELGNKPIIITWIACLTSLTEINAIMSSPFCTFCRRAHRNVPNFRIRLYHSFLLSCQGLLPLLLQEFRLRGYLRPCHACDSYTLPRPLWRCVLVFCSRL
jgi:hypothetical protein